MNWSLSIIAPDRDSALLALLNEFPIKPTCEGESKAVESLRWMFWNAAAQLLDTDGELQLFGNGTIEDGCHRKLSIYCGAKRKTEGNVHERNHFQ